MKLFTRSKFIQSMMAATALTLFGLPVLAQSGFPSKAVTIITAFPAGSGPDSVIRQVGDKLSKLWSQPVLVQNKPGGGGFIAIEAAKSAAPDGYTLLQLDGEHLGALPVLYKSKNFCTIEQLRPGGNDFPDIFSGGRSHRFEMEKHERPD